MRLAPWLPFLARLGELPPCAVDGAHDAAKCTQQGRTLRGVTWAGCPVREVSESPHVRLVRRLEADLTVAPLAGWPSRYAAWVPPFLRTYRAELADARAALRQLQE